MSVLDYYARLGVSPAASNDELRHAWRSRAFDLHPDRTPGDDGAAFRAVVEAWEVLSSPEGRARYDREQTPSPESLLRPEGATSPPCSAPPERQGWGWGTVSPWQAETQRQRQAAEDARRRCAYEDEQARLEGALGPRLGDWTRWGTLRNGSIGRRR